MSEATGNNSVVPNTDVESRPAVDSLSQVEHSEEFQQRPPSQSASNEDLNGLANGYQEHPASNGGIPHAASAIIPESLRSERPAVSETVSADFVAYRDEPPSEESSDLTAQHHRHSSASKPRVSEHSQSENLEIRNGHALNGNGYHKNAATYHASDNAVSESSEQNSVSSERARGMRLLINDTPRMNLILSFLTLSQILAMMVVEKNAKKAVFRYFHTVETLNFSEFYGVIGSPNIDGTFYNLIEHFTNVRHLSFRFCTQLKATHLDRIISLLTSGDADENEQIETLDLFFCSKLNQNAPFKISNRLPNLKWLNLGRCHLITSPENINGLKPLLSLPLEYFAFSLNPDLTVNDAIEIVSLLIHDDSFRNLKVLDFEHGCQLFQNERVDLDDLFERGFEVRLPPNAKRVRRSG